MAAGAMPASAQSEPELRLVVILVVDQLRGDYIDRFRPYFGDDGFNRLMRDGARMTQGRYLHGIMKTCAGHATIATGASPAVHGIIGNDWWNLAADRVEYCSRDDASPLIGVERQGRSPKNLIGSTIGDVLKLATGGSSRVITVSGKDRSAIMLGGHSADAAYWMEDTLFVTSRYYTDAVPDWVLRINASGAVTSWFGETWGRVLAESEYAVQGADDAPWERDVGGMGRSFPHVLGTTETTPGPGFVRALEHSPFQNELVIDFAMEAVRSEGLGADAVPDILGVSLSGNDHVGHAFGPDSHEVLDMTVRTDRLLARFIAFLESEIGLENVVLVLTADHGVAPIPEYVQQEHPGLGGMRLSPGAVAQVAEAAMLRRYGGSPTGRWVRHQGGPYVYLSELALANRQIVAAEAEILVAAALDTMPGINAAHTRTDLVRMRAEAGDDPVVRSFHPERSGHVMYVSDPYVVEDGEPDGTTHGSPWSYDQAVPILFLGGGIRPGAYHGDAFVIDIAPTLSLLLGIDRPPAARGRVLTELLR
jgi:predicted AlkP superfamily pyrophosphatase or phosphodiesterase